MTGETVTKYMFAFALACALVHGYLPAPKLGMFVKFTLFDRKIYSILVFHTFTWAVLEVMRYNDDRNPLCSGPMRLLRV